MPNSWHWSSSSSVLRSLADGLSDFWAAVDANDVEEADHEHGEEGDNDVDEGDDQHLGRNMFSLSLSQGNWIKFKVHLIKNSLLCLFYIN